MKKIIQHIETLIRRHDYAIVPDLGGFIVQQNSAKISEHQITPPLASIGFNPLMNTSDGLLAIEISRAEKISFREAMQLIEKEILALKTQLKKGEKAECGRIGFFTMPVEDKLAFTSAETYSLLPSNYGLETIYATQIEEKAKTDSGKVIQIKLPSTRTAMKYAAAVAIAVGLFFTVPKMSQGNLDFAAINPMNLFNQTDETTETTSTKSLTIAEPTFANTATDTKVNEENAHIIVACWRTNMEANKYVNSLHSVGYEKSHVLVSKKLHRVAIASFATVSEATEFINKLKTDAPEFSDAWIYVEK